MIRIAASTAMILATALICNAQTYRWTDDRGVTYFTDSPESVPAKYRKKMKTGPGITIRDPGIKEELQLQQQRAIQEEANSPHVEISPDPEPRTVQKESTPVKIEEPPPRTKSQKIRDNIERRRLEEEKALKSGSSGE